MPELQDIINDIPDAIANPDENEVEDSENEEAEEVETEESTEEDKDTDDESEDEDSEEDEDDNDDYFTTAEEDDKVVPPVAPVVEGGEDEAKFVLDRIQKISVRIVNKDDKLETLQVYGYGDLPQDYKGIATPYEAGVFQSAVTQQINKIEGLRTQYQTAQTQKNTEQYMERENKAIAEDLTELRGDGVFPKFKGVPGSKEFNDSAGAKEFDRVVAFMNERNDQYSKRAQSGGAYRHIGFREAFELLNGSAIKAEKSENSARKKAAGKIVTKRGATATSARQSPRRVTNLTDLADEFVMGNG